MPTDPNLQPQNTAAAPVATPAPVPPPAPVVPPAPIAPAAPTPAMAPVTSQMPSAPAAQPGLSPWVAIGIIVVVLLLAGGAYAYWMLGMPRAAAPVDNALVTGQTPMPPQDEMSAMESELNADSTSNFDAEMTGLEQSF